MKKNKMLCWALSLVMALTVFSIPVGAVFADEGNDQYCLAGSEFIEATGQFAFTPYGTEVNYADMIMEPEDGPDARNASMAVCTNRDGAWDYYYAPKIKWTNDDPSVAAIKYYDGKQDKDIICSDQTLIRTADSDESSAEVSFKLVPKKEGQVNLSASVYDTIAATEPVATISLKVTITASDISAIKKAAYEQYLNWYSYNADYADYNWNELFGSLPALKDFNDEQDLDIMKITEDEVMGIVIQATIGENVYTANLKKEPEDNRYEFSANFAGTDLGAPVTVTYTMGDYTKTEKLCVSKMVTPNITVKNYTYNGNTRYPSFTVKIGNTTLKSGFEYEKNGLKNVGKKGFDIWNTPNSKYRFYETKYFKINPKGTYVKSLKRAKRAFTVSWAKQATKMSASRVTGYQIQYSTSSKFTKKTTKLTTVKGYSATSKKISKLKKKKGYYVRVRTYKTVSSVNYYSAWSKAKYVKTK